MEILSLLVSERAPVLLLVLARMLGLTLTFPVFSAPWVPPVARIALAFGLTLAVQPAVPALALPTGMGLYVLLGRELAVGLAAGFAGQALFAAASGAGTLIDLDMGFGMVHVFDPTTGGGESIVSRLYHMLALFVFFALNGHLTVVRSVAGSLRSLPPGSMVVGESSAMTLVSGFAAVLELAVRLALPAYAALVISAVILATLARAAPTLNLLAVGFSVKIPVALVFLVLALPLTGHVLQRVVMQGQALIEQVLFLAR